MKFLPFFIAVLFSCNCSAQRFLTEQFDNLDSTIAGVYGTAIDYQSNTQDLLYDIYAPHKDDDPMDARPLIIYIHGGGFTSGTRTLPSIQKICRTMARKGYVVANIDYRLDPNFSLYNSASDRRAMTDAMHDAKQAIRYFKANASDFGIDTAKVFIGGESAGAMTSMMAAYVDKQSEVEFYPMAVPNDPIGSDVNLDIGNGVQGVMCLCGWLLDTLAMEGPLDPPLLWTHGIEDNLIPVELAFAIVLRATNIGLPITARAYQGATHCPWFYGLPSWEAYLDSTVVDITNFLYPIVTSLVSETKSLDAENQIELTPNPFTSEISITSLRLDSFDRATLMDGMGRLVVQKEIEAGLQLNFNLPDIHPGLYYLVLEGENGRAVEKLIKVK